MKSKEERFKLFESIQKRLGYDKTFDAAEEYAQQESVAFATWIVRHCMLYKSSDDYHYYTSEGSIRKTPTELYNLFKESNETKTN